MRKTEKSTKLYLVLYCISFYPDFDIFTQYFKQNHHIDLLDGGSVSFVKPLLMRQLRLQIQTNQRASYTWITRFYALLHSRMGTFEPKFDGRCTSTILRGAGAARAKR